MILKSHIFDDELPVENQGSFFVRRSVSSFLPFLPLSSPLRVRGYRIIYKQPLLFKVPLENLKFKCFVFNLMESSIF